MSKKPWAAMFPNGHPLVGKQCVFQADPGAPVDWRISGTLRAVEVRGGHGSGPKEVLIWIEVLPAPSAADDILTDVGRAAIGSPRLMLTYEQALAIGLQSPPEEPLPLDAFAAAVARHGAPVKP